MLVFAAQLAICMVHAKLFGEATEYKKLVHIPLPNDSAERQLVLCFLDESTFSPADLAFVLNLAMKFDGHQSGSL